MLKHAGMTDSLSGVRVYKQFDIREPVGLKLRQKPKNTKPKRHVIAQNH